MMRARNSSPTAFNAGSRTGNRERLEPGFPSEDWSRIFERDIRMQRLEGGFLEELRAEVVDEAARRRPMPKDSSPGSRS